MEYRSQSGWLLAPRIDRRIDRNARPATLSLADAVSWVRKNRPALWIGSPFSAPEPAGLPSGASVMTSMLEAIFPDADMPGRDFVLFPDLSRRWPLEALFDEFRLVGFDLSKEFLQEFNNWAGSAQPTPLHDAVVRYYSSGLSGSSLCITTNWDNLVETAFRRSGWNVLVAGPERPPNVRTDPSAGTKDIVVLHPHGSFEGKDCVCSYSQEQRGIDLLPSMLNQPTLFLGYSGYEPSIYQRLEHTEGQLWCVKSEADFDIPAKRRLLSRPNTYVYVGDIQDLLNGLCVLSHWPRASDKVASLPDLPGDLQLVMQLSLLASAHASTCVLALDDLLREPISGPPYDFRRVARLGTLTRALVNHVRDRTTDGQAYAALDRLNGIFDSEQVRYTMAAHLLRHQLRPHKPDLEKLLHRAESATNDISNLLNTLIYPGIGPGPLDRGEFYRRFLRRAAPLDNTMAYHYVAQMRGDLSAAAECLEIAAFERVRDGDLPGASNIFDCCANYYYLRGLWNAGYLNEQSSRNPEFLIDVAANSSLMM